MKSTGTLMPWLKKRFFSHEFAKFLVVGAVNTGGGYVIYLGLLQAFDYRVAYTVSFVLGVMISYWLNAWYVFKEPLSLKKFLKFPLVYLVQYLTGGVLLYLLVGQFGLSPLLAPLFVVALNLPITFLLSRLIVK